MDKKIHLTNIAGIARSLYALDHPSDDVAEQNDSRIERDYLDRAERFAAAGLVSAQVLEDLAATSRAAASRLAREDRPLTAAAIAAVSALGRVALARTSIRPDHALPQTETE